LHGEREWLLREVPVIDDHTARRRQVGIVTPNDAFRAAALPASRNDT